MESLKAQEGRPVTVTEGHDEEGDFILIRIPQSAEQRLKARHLGIAQWLAERFRQVHDAVLDAPLEPHSEDPDHVSSRKRMADVFFDGLLSTFDEARRKYCRRIR